MEGKPRFSGGSPESDQNIGPEVSQWRESLGESPWAGSSPESVAEIVKPEKPTPTETHGGQTELNVEAKPQLDEPAESPKGAIDEALTDSKADVADVQAMMEHFFEANKDV